MTPQQVTADAQSVQQILAGLEELQDRAEGTMIVDQAEQRGYLTPDEDDRVRQGLLAYRNYRLALYEIILRHEGYSRLRPAGLRLKAFLTGFAAALILYAKSLRLNELAARSKLVRAKLNEPEPKFELEEGFFDEVMAGFCSLRNYGLLLGASWFWTSRRGAIRALARSEPEPWAQLETVCMREHRTIKEVLRRILRQRLRLGWRSFCQTAFRPVNRFQYGVRSRVGGRFAGTWLQQERHLALDDPTLDRLHQALQPGDWLLMRSEGKLTASLLPGFWAHSALYLGNRQFVLDLDPSLAAVTGDDNPLGYVIEGIHPCVRVVSLKTCLDADHVLAVRPQLDAGSVREAIQAALQYRGRPYDFEFDFNTTSRMVCTELLYRVYQGRNGIAFQLIKRLGNFNLTADDLAAQAMQMADGEFPSVRPLILVLRRNDGWRINLDPHRIRTLLGRIQKGWRPLRKPGGPHQRKRE